MSEQNPAKNTKVPGPGHVICKCESDDNTQIEHENSCVPHIAPHAQCDVNIKTENAEVEDIVKTEPSCDIASGHGFHVKHEGASSSGLTLKTEDEEMYSYPSTVFIKTEGRHHIMDIELLHTYL